MATLTVNFISPAPNSTVGETISVSGNVSLDVNGFIKLNPKLTAVQFGDGGPVVQPTLSGSAWSCTGTVSPTAINGDLTIGVSANATFNPTKNPETQDDVSGTGNLIVKFQSQPPSLTVAFDPPQLDVIVTTLPYQITVSGTASPSSALSSVTHIQYNLDAAGFKEVGNYTSDRSRWSQVLELTADEHTIKIQVTDSHNNTASAVFNISVKTPFLPTDPVHVFEPTTYLWELLTFAKRQITAAPTAQIFASQFFQPFDKLIADTYYSQAVQPLHQARIAIEVLRQLNPAVPPETEQRFRMLAYQTILREIGTSYSEMRLARVASPAARRTLAARIGIEIGNVRPDSLDQMLLLPANITDAALETLFGYRSTAPVDPFALPDAKGATFAQWQQSALRDVWQRDDAQTRDSAAGAQPIIDPDVIATGNITTQTGANSALSLWNARTTWIVNKLNGIVTDAGTVADPLARFNQLVLHYVGNFNLPALAASDSNGTDISAALAPFYLDLDAFRFLALCSQLLTAGTLLQSEWDDIFAILLEIQKRLQYRQWRLEETTQNPPVILEPAQFQPDADGPAPEVLQWRGSAQTFADWRRTLIGRASQLQTVQKSFADAVDAAETQTLPGLRDALIQIIGQGQVPPVDLNTEAEALSRSLLIDFRLNAGPKTTRADQAIETLQGILFSVRSGRLTNTESTWALTGSTFDAEWVWMGTFRTWLAAIKVFAYPENLLAPNLYVKDSPFLIPTAPFIDENIDNKGLILDLRTTPKMTPDRAREKAANYLTRLKSEVPDASAALTALHNSFPDSDFSLTDQLSDSQLVTRQQMVAKLFGFGPITNPTAAPSYLRELCWLVPMAIALRLQSDREYLAALDWFRTVYAFNLPPDNRKIYYGLKLEESLTSQYARLPAWLTTELNPHIVVQAATEDSVLVGRQNAYTRFTILSIVKCLLAYADLQFSGSLAESTSEARTLYETAVDLLNLPDLQPEKGADGKVRTDIPFPPNPVWQSLLMQAQSSLAKIHNGLNIAGVPVTPSAIGSATVFLPSQYRYSVLVDRAKNLVGIAQQVEAAFLGALEKGDAENYSLLQANNDIKVAASSITLSDLKVADANITATEAQLQKNKADVQYEHFDGLVRGGLNREEIATLAALGTAAAFRTANAFNAKDFLAFEGASNIAEAASAVAQLAQQTASYERMEDDWNLQRNLADVDRQTGDQQILNAQNQQLVAQQERKIAGQQLDHATAVLDFLANKFTNAELFEWMSGVLGGVYAYFLQQATAIAQLAEAQLAFERQAPPSGFISADYWQDTSNITDGAASTADRQGLTGSERLLQDITQLDQYAFETDRRKLHIAQTVMVSEVAAMELQTFRETGVLVLATPMALFDQDFPGHYLRLIKSVQVSLIALAPAVRGVRATLSASGVSRVIVPGDEFQSVTLSRSPEAFSFTSPLNATGLFDLEPDTGILLPFEGMGVDTVWQLELPKAANPFDYRTIADVQLTIKYTALNSYDYREQVLRSLDRSFSGDRSFSLQDEFPDAWYLLNNPETVADAASQMKATLSIQRGHFRPNVDGLAVQQVSFFCLRNDGVTQELNIPSLTRVASAQITSSTTGVTTVGGVAGTRRPSGAPWQPLIGKDPVGDWSIQLENTDAVRALFKSGSILDIALVLTVGGVTPMWP